MKIRKTIPSTQSTITLYGDRFEKLERLCFENKISSTAFYNTVIEAFATGKLTILDGENTSRRVTGENENEVLDQLRFSIGDKARKKLF